MSTSSLCRALSGFVLVISVAAGAQTPAVPQPGAISTQIPGQSAILMGTDWYPEQWPELVP